MMYASILAEMAPIHRTVAASFLTPANLVPLFGGEKSTCQLYAEIWGQKVCFSRAVHVAVKNHSATMAAQHGLAEICEAVGGEAQKVSK